MKSYKLEKQIETRYTADVIVCGGGTAGAFAALAAANEGKSVLILEQFGGLGGTATLGLVTPVMHSHIEGDPQCSYISNELNKKLREYNAVDASKRIFDPMMLRITLEEMCMKANVKVLFHTFISDVITVDNKVQCVIAVNKSGTFAVEGKVFIDCTGDADVTVLAGGEYTKGNPDDENKTQPISLRYIIDGVDIPALAAFFKAEIERTGINCAIVPTSDDIYGAVCRVGKYTLGELFDKAIAAGDLIPEDRWYWQMFKVTGRPYSLAFNNPEFFEDVDGTNAEHLTRTQLEGKQAIHRQLEFYKKYMKGFEKAYISDIAAMVGIRETRNVIAEYTLTAVDLLSKAKFADAFCQSNYPVDIHGKTLNFGQEITQNTDGRPYYEIPVRSLIVKGIDNLLVAGRCLGAEFLAQSSLRVQQSVRSSGEAAGILASIAVDKAVPVRELDTTAVPKIMKDKGAVFSKI